MRPGLKRAAAPAVTLLGLALLGGCGGEKPKGPPLPYTPAPLEPAKAKETPGGEGRKFTMPPRPPARPGGPASVTIPPLPPKTSAPDAAKAGEKAPAPPVPLESGATKAPAPPVPAPEPAKAEERAAEPPAKP